MGSKSQKVEEIYKRHNLKWEEIPEEDEITDLTSVLLPLEDHMLCQWDTTEAIGAWVIGKLHEDFSYIVQEVERMSEGAVSVEEFSSTNNHDGDEYEGTIEISFKHNNKEYSWSFTVEDPSEYYEGVLEWAKKTLGKGYYEEWDELVSAWYVNPEALKELRAVVSEAA